jgi:hypothetical protein
VSVELTVLQEIRIASPCEASWEQMQGDERSRFCDHCQLHVYNLSAMSAPEAAALVQEKEGRLCVRYYARPDGTMLVQDCPVGFQAARRRVLSRLATAAAALFGLFGARWPGDTAAAGPKNSAGTPALQGAPRPPSRAMMGDLALPATHPRTAQPVTPPPHLMGKIVAPTHPMTMGEVSVAQPVRPRKKPVKAITKPPRPRQPAKRGRKA